MISKKVSEFIHMQEKNSIKGKERNAAFVLLREVMLIKENDKVAITCDEFSDEKVKNVLMKELNQLGAVPVALSYPSNLFNGSNLPSAVSEGIFASDVWLELSGKYALYSETRFEASKRGVRYSCLTGMDYDLFLRAFNGINYNELLEFGKTLSSAIDRSERIEIISGNGQILTAFGKVKSSVVSGIPNPSKGSTTMFAGTVNWISQENRISGEIVVDGSIWPPVGVLKEPITFKIDKGIITEISGGSESGLLNKWLEDMEDENMYRVAHLTIGFHPNIRKLRGIILEDERLFGSFQIGFGTQGPAFGKKWIAKSHSDAIIKCPTVKLDGNNILSEGKFTLKNFSKSNFNFLEG